MGIQTRISKEWISSNKKGRTKIYTIGYGAPAGAKEPLELMAAMTGGKSKFVEMDEIREMEKNIDDKKTLN